jgi:hypothetical protein
MKLNEKTYGDSPAAIILVEKLNSTNIKISKIGIILSNFNRTLHELEKIDSRIGLGLAHSSFKTFRESCKRLPLPFSTYTANVLDTNYKKWLLKQNWKTPYNKRKK